MMEVFLCIPIYNLDLKGKFKVKKKFYLVFVVILHNFIMIKHKPLISEEFWKMIEIIFSNQTPNINTHQQLCFFAEFFFPFRNNKYCMWSSHILSTPLRDMYVLFVLKKGGGLRYTRYIGKSSFQKRETVTKGSFWITYDYAKIHFLNRVQILEVS